MDFTFERRIKDIQTFDLIGFHGGEIVSSLIIHLQKKALTRLEKNTIPMISHVGLAVRGSDLKPFTNNILRKYQRQISKNQIYVFESTASGKHIDGVKDVHGGYYFGAQLRPLGNLLSKYNGEIYWSPKKFLMDSGHFVKVAEAINEFDHLPYETSTRIMLANICSCMKPKFSTEAVFCSELVTKCLQKVTILPSHINAERVVPLDFYADPLDPSKTLDVQGDIPVLFDLPIKLK